MWEIVKNLKECKYVLQDAVYPALISVKLDSDGSHK